MNKDLLIAWSHNYVEVVGTITEFEVESFVRDSTSLIKFEGVMNCDNAFIQFRGTFSQFDSSYETFIKDFDDIDPIDLKVKIIGSLTASGVKAIYITKVPYATHNLFDGFIQGVAIDNGVIYPTNFAPYFVPLNILESNGELVAIELTTNPVTIDENGVIENNGYPSIVVDEYEVVGDCPKELVDEIIEEREIYLESLKQVV